MNFFKAGFITLFILISSFVHGQNTSQKTAAPAVQNNISAQATEIESHIVSSSMADSVPFKLELKGAFYDPAKKNLPYYFISKTTAYDQSAKPTLLIKKTQLVAEPHASVVKKYFGKYLGGDFSIVPVSSFSKNENLNNHRLYPFRINAMGQVEELVEYDASWQVTSNNNKMLRTSATASFATTSILSSGTWFKIGTTQTGIHKISKALLSSMGIDVSKVDPKKIRIYGNGGKMLPELNSAPRLDDLVENSIQVVGEEDNVFDNNDYILFYATGPTEWVKNNRPTTSSLKFSSIKNRYSDTSFYFLNFDLGQGQRIVTPSTASLVTNISSSSYDYYADHEEDLYNFVKSGRNFYGEYFDINNLYTFTWSDGDFLADSILAEATILSRARDSAKYLINGSGLNFILTTYSVDVDYYLGDYGDVRTRFSAGINPGNASNITVNITKQSPAAIGWLDKITINTRRKLALGTKQFSFRDMRVTGASNICSYNCSVPPSSTITVWEVTDPLHPLMQEFSTSGQNLSFKAKSDVLREFCIAPSTDLYAPTYFGKVPNQNLHAFTQADFVIVTHPLFVSQAQRVATLHNNKDNEGLSYKIATTDQVYNEFSSGRPDASAIRDFVRMLYTRNISAGKEVKYLLLIGDGSYKNRDRSLLNNSNLIPTYQSENSLSPTTSLATDDFYGLMDPWEGYKAEDTGGVDIGVGRFTCRTTSEVNGVIGKIENYYKKDAAFKITDITPENCNNLTETNMGDWRNWMIFLADDGDNALHMNQSNMLTGVVQAKSQLYNIDKIFLDAYQRFSTPGGKRYPDATEDFVRAIKKGALVFNYTGHGGEVGLTEERVLDIPTINAFDNLNKLPLFITATCEFSRYDDPDRTSAGELCLLNPKGGAISMYTTCRVAYSQPNYSLNLYLLQGLLTKRPDGKFPTLGDVVQQTKKTITQSIYFANFHLLGDPALTLAYPKEKVMTSKINNITVTPLSSDTLSALAKITISGFVADTSGNKLTGFNGIVYSSVFDKERVAVCLLNDLQSSTSTQAAIPFQFTTQKNILYRGKSQISNGDFSLTFIVPKDISIAPGNGRISYYATNGQIDASGSYSNVIVGGTSKNVVVDADGPQVSLFFNDKNFVNGSITNEKPVLYADLVDSSGINTVGNGIGHDISAVLDASGANPVILNDYYEANLNSYQSGRVRYPYEALAEGPHRITFKVWDIQNNSNTAYSDFVVAQSAELALKHVLNYPNPFTTHTKFFFEHNQACNPLKVTIQIYTISGKVVKTLQRSVTCEGFRPEGIDWDGKDDYGDKLARGVYIYKLAILDTQNKKAEKIEKLVILN